MIDLGGFSASRRGGQCVVYPMHARMMCIPGRMLVCRSAINGEEGWWRGSMGPEGDWSVWIRYRAEGDQLGMSAVDLLANLDMF